MLKRPQWVKEKIEGKEKEIPIQMTVKKKYTMQPQYANMPTMGMTTGNGMTTGSGVDGTIQPGKMVDVQVHEGEGIIPNNAMQGLTGEEFQGLVETLSSGKMNKNKLREAIGMPTVSEYQLGGIIDKLKTKATNIKNAAWGTNTLDAPETFTKAPETEAQTIQVAPEEKQMYQTKEVKAEPPPKAKTIQVRVPETQTVQTEEVKKEPPPEGKPPVTPPEMPPETVTTPTVSPAGDMVRQGLQKILAEAQGVSDVDRKIADFYLQNLDASNAANLRQLEHQISADPEMSDQAKQAAIMGLRREAAATRAGEVGKLAINSMERASQAARDIVTYGGQVRTYEEVTLPTSRQNLEIERRIFDEFTTPMNALKLEEMQNKMGVDNWERIQDMIDRGLSPEQVNTEMTKMGMQPLTTDEFASIYQAGELGERNWGRQESAAKMYMTLGQWGAAAEAYSNLYGGVDFDFSKLATQENAQNFNQGISQMASYVAAGWDADKALSAAKIDGTMELMEVDEEQFRDFYNASRVNTLDQAWEAVETSKEYQRMLNSTDPAERQEALDMKQLYYAEQFGLLDREILHEYKITGPEPNNKPMGTIYAKSPEDAQAKANEYGAGYTIEDTGNISADIKLPPETEVEDTGSLTEWETFKESVPPELITPDLQKSWQRWVDAGGTGKYDDYRKSTEGKFQNLDVESNDDLLLKKNSDILIEAYKEDPESVKEKKYYYTPPSYEELKGSDISTKTGGFGFGETKTTLNKDLSQSLKSSVGMMTEIPMSDGPVVGQVQDVSFDAQSISMKIKTLDGDIVTIPIYDSDHGSYRPQPKYYGRK